MPEIATGPVLVREQLLLGYGDTDAAGILYYGAVFPWMERISVRYLFDNGIRFDQMLERFGAIGVTRATTCDYLSRASIYDFLDIEMSLNRSGTTSYQLGFTFAAAGSDRLVARGSLTIAYCDPSGRPVAVPAEIRRVVDPDGT